MKILSEYTNPAKPGSFSGLSSFKRVLKKTKKINSKEIKDILLDQETFTLHKPILKRFKRNKIIVNGIDDTWQADLVDLSNIAYANDNYKWLLTVIDVFSKYAWLIPLKNKQAISIVEGFKQILKQDRYPKKLQTDAGNEFINKYLKKHLKNVKMYVLNSEMKASIIERFNLTIKLKMWRYFTFKQTHRYLDVIDDLVKSYNSSYHRTIKTSPEKVNKSNENQIFKNSYGYDKKVGDETFIKYKFKVNDKVRISKSKNIFEKSYTPNWTREIFSIHKILPRVPPVYIIKDEQNEIIKGVFYEQQLQKIYKTDNIYYIENIVKSKKLKNGKKKVFIKWLGYPEKANTWEPEENLIELNNKYLDYSKLEKNDNSINDKTRNERLIFSI